MSDEKLNIRVVSKEEVHMSMRSLAQIVKPIRQQVREFAGEQGFDQKQIYEIQLAVNEAIANIIEHAYDGDESGEIQLSMAAEANGDIEIAIRDFAEKADLDKLVSRDLDDLRDGGIGIFLIKSLMDEVEYDFSEEIGTRLILKKKLKYSQEVDHE